MIPISTRQAKNVFTIPTACIRAYHHFNHQLQGLLLSLKLSAFTNYEGSPVKLAFHVKPITAKTSIPVALGVSLSIYLTCRVLPSSGHSAMI